MVQFQSELRGISGGIGAVSIPVSMECTRMVPGGAGAIPSEEPSDRGMETRQERGVRGGGSGLDEETVRRGQDREASRCMKEDLRSPIGTDLSDSESPRERRLSNVRGYRDRDSESGRRPGVEGGSGAPRETHT